jgi:signal transduction histidine kinase
MTGTMDDTAPVRGRIDRDGHLVAADAALATLHRLAGGVPGGTLAVPQIATVARLARRLGIIVSRGVIAADGSDDVDLWVRAQPDGEAVDLAIVGWSRRPATPPFLAPAAERDHDFLRAGADWAWSTDKALRLGAIGPAAAEAIGSAAATIVGQPLTRLFTLIESEEGVLPILDALAQQAGFDDQIAELKVAPGTRLRLAAVPLIDGDGRFAGFRGVASAVTEQAPAAPIADAAGGAFGERLDAALRRPLDRIINNAESIRSQSEGPLRRDYAEYAADIASAGRHLLALVDDLVDLQAIERPDFAPAREPIDLADVARRAAGLLSVRAADRRVTIDRPALSEALPAMGEFRRALQILVNLVGNAVRYSPDGGMVWIRCERSAGFVAVIVADQGKGVAAADQARIFDKFERVDPTEPGGTGLGLYIARRLARAMGGDIAVDSAPGQGARFILTLPAAE